MNEENTTSAIKKMIIGSIICQYGAYALLDDTKFELKQKVRAVIQAVKGVESWFLHHPNSDENYRKIFREQFGSDEILLIAELVETVFGLKSDDIETVIAALKGNMEEENALK